MVRRSGYRLLILILTATVLGGLGAAEVTFYSGDTVPLMGTNTTLEWGANHTFNTSSITYHSSALAIGDGNISIYANDTQQVNVTIDTYNRSTPSDGDTLIDVQTRAGQPANVTFRFTGIPTIQSGRYELARDGQVWRNQTSGGTITWHHADWTGQHNFSVVYHGTGDTTNPTVSLSLGSESISPGESVSISCNATDSSGISSEQLSIEDPDGDEYFPSCGSSFSQTGVVGDYIIEYSATDTAGNSNSIIKLLDVTNGNDNGGTGGTSSTGGTTGGSSGGDTTQPNMSNTFTREFSNDRLCLRKVEIQTATEATGVSFSTSQYSQGPGVTIANAYCYVDVTASGVQTSSIESATLEFAVNNSFVSQHDAIRISRHGNGWEQADTSRTGQRGGTTSYRASLDSLSIFAVHGVALPDEESPGPACGDGSCNGDEDWQTCASDCSRPQEVIDAERALQDAEGNISDGEKGHDSLKSAQDAFDGGNYTAAEDLALQALAENRSGGGPGIVTIIGGLFLLLVLAVVGFILYTSISFGGSAEKVDELHAEIGELMQEKGQQHPEFLGEKFQEAEDAMNEGDYEHAVHVLETIRDHLRQD